MKILGNPWDGVSLDEKKQFALHFYYTHLQVVGCQVGAKQKSREHAGTLVALSQRTIAEWVRDFETTTYITESRRGKHSKTVSPINNPSFREEFRTHVKENSRKSGEANMTAADLAQWVNEKLQLGQENSYSESKSVRK